MDLDARRQLPLFTIGIVQKLSGLTARQIRYYETHGLVTPVRSEGKQRLFSFEDVERLMSVRALLDDGLNMAGVKARFAQVKRQSPRNDIPASDLSDAQIYKRMQQEIAEGPNRSQSMFLGDLSRFYRKK